MKSTKTAKFIVLENFPLYGTTEQRFRYMALADAKIWISKMHHYDGFSQIRSHSYVLQYATNTPVTVVCVSLLLSPLLSVVELLLGPPPLPLLPLLS